MPGSVFTSTFGGSAVSPADVAFAEYTFGANLTLFWPAFSAGNPDVAARFMRLTATTTSLNVVMPEADLVSNGQDVIIFNASSNTFNVVDSLGGAITTIAAGQAYYIILRDNSTEAGVWQIIQFGVGTGSASAAALAGAGLLAAAGLLNVNLDSTTVSTSYSLTAAQRAILQVWTGGTGTIILPTASSVGDGFFFPLANNGSGSITVATTGGDLIDGTSSSVFSQTQSGFVISSGSGWNTVGKGLQNNFAVTLLNLNVAGAADVTETSSQAQNIIQQFTGLLTANINVIVPNTVQLYYIFNNTTGSFSLTLKTSAGMGVTIAQGTHAILYCDGTNVVNAFTANVASTIAISPGSANSPNFSFVGNPNTGIYSPSLNQIAMTAGGFEVMNFASAASSVNYIQAMASATGNAVSLSALGSDANIGINYVVKGTGSHNFVANGGATQFFIGNVSSAVNQLGVTGSATGSSPLLAATGSDTNIGINYVTKGTGTHQFTGQIIGNLTGNVTGNASGTSGSTTGNAATATALQTARTIGGISFDGTSNITVATATNGFTISGGNLILTGSTSGTTNLISAAIAGTSALTLPSATDTLVGKATTDTFTNKTFDTAGTGNLFKINGTAISSVTGSGAAVLASSPTIATAILTGTTNTGQIITTNTNAGNLSIGNWLINNSSTANTGVDITLQPSSISNQGYQIRAVNDGLDNVDMLMVSSAAGSGTIRGRWKFAGGLVIDEATGTTNSGDINITGNYKQNGVPLTSTWTLLNTQTATSSTFLNFVSVINSSYDYYVFILQDLTFSTSSTTFDMLMSANNGGSYQSSYNYTDYLLNATLGTSSAFTFINGAGSATIKLCAIANSGAVNSISGKVELFNPNGTARPKMITSVLTHDSGDLDNTTGQNTVNTAVNAVRFSVGSGVILSGKIYCYGVKNS